MAAGCATYSPPPPEPAAPVVLSAAPRPVPRRALDLAAARLREAEKRLARLDTAGALSAIDEAEAALGAPPLPRDAFAPWAAAETQRASVALADGRKDHARAVLARILDEDATHAPDPARVAPEIVDLFAELRRGRAGSPAPPPRLFLDASPAPAAAFDGAPAPVLWRGVPADDADDRGWYRKWWWWVVLGVGGVLVASSRRRQ